MVEYPTRSRCRLMDYPNHTCYSFRIHTCSSDALTVQNIMNGTSNVKMDNKDYDHAAPRDGVQRYYQIADNRTSIIATGKAVPPFGSRLALHRECRVPSTMLKKYDVVTSVNAETPEYYVLPHTFNYDVFIDNAMLFINKDAEAIIALAMPYMVDRLKLPKSPELYLNLLRSQLSTVFPELFKYVPMDGSRLHSVVEVTDDLEFLYFQKLLPEDRIVNEDTLFIGDDELTYDVFKSCYLMLQSTDNQMQRTALITLGQRDCRRYTEILRWLFQTHKNVVYDVKRGNKPFSYLHTKTTRGGRRIWHIREPYSRLIGRKLVADLTNGQVRWENGVFMKPEGYTYKDDNIRHLAEHELN